MVPTPPAPPRSSASKCLAEGRNIIPDELARFNEVDTINNFEDITTKINNVGIDGVKFISSIVGNLLVLQSAEFLDGTGVPRFILQISNDLSFNAFHSGVKCTIGTLSANRVTVLNRWTNVQETILFLNGLGMDQKKNVMHQQLKSMKDLTYVGEKKYEFGTIVGKRMKALTKDTANCFAHTCNGLVELATFLLNLNHEYVLLGIFTSDFIEKDVGKLRQGSGGTYFITVQQITEKVAIKKTKLLLSLDVDVGDFNAEAGHNYSSCGFMLTEDMCTIMDNLPKFEDRTSEDTKIALIYIAGYIVRKNYIEDTFKYHQKYGAFVNDLNRGGLTIPGDSACQWSFYCYVMFREVANYTCRKSLCNILMIISEFYGFNLERKHGMIMSNIPFNNHSHLYTPRSSKERKQKIVKLGDY